ncbi:MAG: zinc ribbon domain-containing protein [Ilumatobacteraceae bacterium]
MSCPTCGALTRPGQRFCMDCGTSLTPAAAAGVPPTSAVHWQGDGTDPTAVLPIAASPINGAAATIQQPAVPRAGSIAGPTMYARSTDPNSPHVTQVTSAQWIADAGSTSSATDWGSIDIVEQTPSTTYDVLNPSQPERPSMMTWRPLAADARPAPASVPWLNDEVPNRIHIVVFGGIAAVLGIIAGIITVGSYKLPDGITTHFRLHDLASNAPLAMIVAVAVLAAGAVLGIVGLRLGIGLAGGAASAIVGLVALDAAQVANQMQVAKRAASEITVVTVTWEVGFFLLVGAGVFSLIVFFTSLAAGADDGRRRLNPVICGIGALGPVAVALGPMIPNDGRSWSDNWSTAVLPATFVWLRIAALAIVAIVGVVGFATRRRWGAGLAVGGLAVVIVQWFGTMRTPVDPRRASVGIYGLSGTDGTPHVLVLIGLAVTVAAAVAAVLVQATAFRGPDTTRHWHP